MSESEIKQGVKELVLIDLISSSQADIKEYPVHQKNWGKETWVINNEQYCMKVLEVLKNRMCSVHYHRIKDETFHITKGYVYFEFWGPNIDLVKFNENKHKPDHIMTLWPGSSVHIPPYTAHRFTAKNGPAMIVEVSTHHMEEDSVRLIPSPPYSA